MVELYLIRHGQAGLRSDYDRLSETGFEQARALGEWLRKQRVAFDMVISGDLRRQRETAAAMGLDPVADPQWNEFDLDAVYASVAPQLSAVDEEFRQDFASMAAEAADPCHPVHRAWRTSDFKVVKAWLHNQFAVDCETWNEFRTRVLAAFGKLDALVGVRRVCVVTSATPIGLVTASLFDAGVQQVFALAGSLHNSSFTVLKKREMGWSMAGFNHTPHLDDEKLRTLR